MYLARLSASQSGPGGPPCFVLRQSIKTPDGCLAPLELFDLGPDPDRFIHYPGGNAFYFDDQIQEAAEAALFGTGIPFDPDELEDLLWPWVKPDIRMAVETFRGRSVHPGRPDAEEGPTPLHDFDRRRAHYLKFGLMDQGAADRIPTVLYRHLSHCCRDEIEQYFLRQEMRLRDRELKSYVYTAFDLQRFFQSFMAAKMPHVLDQTQVDDYFIKEVCRLNREIFGQEQAPGPYLVRYLIMFFDHTYAGTTLLDDFANAFMNRHRVFRPSEKNPVREKTALELFGLKRPDLDRMTRKELTRIFRKLALKAHPDSGGSDRQFIELSRAFDRLLGLLPLK